MAYIIAGDVIDLFGLYNGFSFVAHDLYRMLIEPQLTHFVSLFFTLDMHSFNLCRAMIHLFFNLFFTVNQST